MRKTILICFFIIQLGAIVCAIGSSQKYFAWVPFDEISFYQVDVRVNGKNLTDKQISSRYHIPNPGRENRSIGHVFSQIQQYEDTYGKADSANVEVVYRVNGKPSKVWRCCQ
ncbi:hypothetical protein [Algoriphagus sediminis]|uniref:Uncharacterized protein n=1 Tax=Algoriphagus sediminis TaxID=3057113 RepID=A0ABT7YEV1_9BACT|nr:hypothetical protein [Algoriphagus sediminis]MDN3205053.1 hypothetical protein [Algoriphagus sediminis]